MINLQHVLGPCSCAGQDDDDVDDEDVVDDDDDDDDEEDEEDDDENGHLINLNEAPAAALAKTATVKRTEERNSSL